MTQENDLILINVEGKPLVFARIEEIIADTKPDWYHVKLLMLQVPLKTVTWILKDVYIDGQEFPMNGKKIKFEKIHGPQEIRHLDSSDYSKGAEVISLADHRK